MTWKEISQEVGVAISTIRRFETATDAEADGVLALVGWLGVAPETFIVGSRVSGVPLPAAGDGVIRVDMVKVLSLSESSARSRTTTRTTIQRLVEAAQVSKTTVASLTRWCPA